MIIEKQHIRYANELQEADFKRLSSFIYKNYGINLYPAKRILLQSRLQKRLRALGFETYKEYCDYVLDSKTGPDEFQEMVECITTNKTEFFRENNAFNYIEKFIVPDFIKQAGESIRFRVWSAGASTGKEAYSTAMILNDFVDNHPGFSYHVSASDISMEVLKIARMAIYPMDELNEVPHQFRRKYLLKSKDKKNQKFRVAPLIREKVKFFWLNLLSEDYRLAEKFDVILCRNTMIYFDKPTQEKIVHRFMNLLNTNGHLILGQSESLINFDFGIQQVAPSIYMKL